MDGCDKSGDEFPVLVGIGGSEEEESVSVDFQPGPTSSFHGAYGGGPVAFCSKEKGNADYSVQCIWAKYFAVRLKGTCMIVQ